MNQVERRREPPRQFQLAQWAGARLAGEWEGQSVLIHALLSYELPANAELASAETVLLGHRLKFQGASSRIGQSQSHLCRARLLMSL